jgi:argininosuccinate synthase
MDRPTLQKKLDAILDEYERNQTFGSVELCFNRGQVEVIRQSKSEKFFNERVHTHESNRNR